MSDLIMNQNDESEQDSSDEDYPFSQYSDYEEFYSKCKSVRQFCKVAPDLPHQNNVVQLLLTKLNACTSDKKIIYKYFADLIFHKGEYKMLIYFFKIFSDVGFKQVISKELSRLFKLHPLDDRPRIGILNKFLYNVQYKPIFFLDPVYKYNITPLYNAEFPKSDQTLQFFKYDDTIKDQTITKQTIYFWKLWNDIDKVQKEEIGKIDNEHHYSNLYPFSRAFLLKSPVALLFAGGAQTSKSRYYADETNCCLMAHHLCEMGYRKENILCFVEGGIFNSNLFPPFIPNQIRISIDTLSTYQAFKTNLRFEVFERSMNNPSMFLYVITKVVMDAKAPVLIFVSNHGGDDTLSFPFPNVDNESKIEQQSFIELCDVLETFKKHVLFILDCCGSEEFVSFDQASQYKFIHFITSSMNQNDIPGLTKSVSLSTMSFVNPKNSSQEIKLSSQFTRFFLDAIHSITYKMKLSEFVNHINSQGNVGFKAKLRSNNPSIYASIFLQAPLYKYIKYTELSDTYKSGDVIYSGGKILTSYLSFKKSCIINNDVVPDSSHEELYVGKDEEFLNFKYDEVKKFKALEVAPKTSNKIPLTYDEVKQIIDATVIKFAKSYEEMYELNNQKLVAKIREKLYMARIYDWFNYKYDLGFEAYMYASHLAPLYHVYPNMIDEIKEFIQNEVNILSISPTCNNDKCQKNLEPVSNLETSQITENRQ